jgi:hypothetical protein
MQKNLYFLMALVLVMAGCGISSHNMAEHDRIWTATREVLTRHNLIVKESLYREGTMIAVSQISGDFLNKSRVKVVARVVEGEDGHMEPAIRVLNQWDNSDALVHGRAEYQAGYRWINLSTNAALEAQIYNEIQAQLGRYNPYQGKAWQPPVKGGNKVTPATTSLTQPGEKQLEEIR